MHAIGAVALVATKDVLSPVELADLLGDIPHDDVIQTCAGAWIREGDHFRFWRHPAEPDDGEVVL